MPTLYIIAGPNGAGKTTAAYNLLPEVFQTVEFVNADEIAKGLSPFNQEGVAFQAGRIMLQRLEQLIAENKSLAFETTLSGLAYLKFLKQTKIQGYTERRYQKGIKNFKIYSDISDNWYIYDNSDIVAKFDEGDMEVFNFEIYSKITGDE